MPLRQIVLMRHGIAEDTPPMVFYKGVQRQGTDFDRALTQEGLRRARLVVQSLAKVCDSRPLIFASPLVRAQQTAAIFSEYFPEVQWGPETLDSLTPDSFPPETLSDLARLADQHDTKTVVMVGHQPHISAFCSLLVTGTQSGAVVQFGRATVALLEPQGSVQAGRCPIRYVLRPKIFNGSTA